MRFAIGMAVVFAAGVALAQDAKDGKKAAKLEGTYVIVSLEMGGEKIPDELFSKAPEDDRTIKITGDKLISSKKGKDDSSQPTRSTRRSRRRTSPRPRPRAARPRRVTASTSSTATP